MNSVHADRPRNLDWPRASALLYGDWGTSKAYVIGLAFVAAGFSSLPIILAVCVLTALVGYNYTTVCRCFPDGGGVYSAARQQGRALAVVGALLLVADLTVTASLSSWEALSYLGVPDRIIAPCSMVAILAIGVLNYYGPRHSGTLAVALALPTVGVVIAIILFALPHLTLANLEGQHLTLANFEHTWVAFVGVILALSGVEAIANLTGTMKLDRGSLPGEPQVGRNAIKAILPVGIEVTVGTALLGWAMLSLPKALAPQMQARHEDMLRFIAEYYGQLAFGEHFAKFFGLMVGVIFALLLLSAVNTAIAALIGLLFMVARDGEMPKSFTRLNHHGVPWAPLIIAASFPVVVLVLTQNLEALAGLYAIGVVGAICVNLGSCTLNGSLKMSWFERGLMGATTLLLVAVEFTLAKTKPDALFFVSCVLTIGLLLRAWAQRHAGMTTVTMPVAVASIIDQSVLEKIKAPPIDSPRILVCLRGITPVLAFAIEEARLRGATLYILYVREVAVLYQGGNVPHLRWQDDPQAAVVLNAAVNAAKECDVSALPVFASAQSAAPIIVDSACTLGADFVMLGASHRHSMTKLLKGNVVTDVASSLPESIHLIIHG
ncbi:MAG: amino acid permease [Terrimicrobiaceae bacterium]|nr:amino acid permease [Terrimicrobiaceae bacterium]